MSLLKRSLAELVGTFVLTAFGCGVAVVSSHYFQEGFLVCTALAFGLTIVAMAYSIGNISGCHINPAVSLAVFIKDRKAFPLKDLLAYVGAQIVGAILAALLLELIFVNAGFTDFAIGSDQVNTAVLGTGGAGLALGFLVEVVLTFVFVLAILGVTSKKEYSGIAGIVIGLSLTLVHLFGIGLTGTSVNPARSIGPALIAMMNGVFEPIQQIWIFILAPLIGGALAAFLYKFLAKAKANKEAQA